MGSGPADKTGVNSNVRSALIGGLAATFVVAASLAPKLASDSRSEVTIHQASSDAEQAGESTTTVPAPETTATTAAPTTTTTAPLEERVTNVEHRVTVIEQTTTTTAPKPTTPNLSFYFEEPAGRFGRDADQWWVIVFRPSDSLVPADFPGLHVRATVETVNGPQDVTAEVTLSSDGKYVGNVVAFVERALLDPALAGPGTMSRPSPVYLSAATVEWNGGTQPVIGCC
jgi:hypothetical protein